MATTNTTTSLTIRINGKEIHDTFYGLNSEVRRLNKELQNLTPGTERFRETAEQLRAVRERFNTIRQEINQANQTLGIIPSIIERVSGGFLNFGNIARGVFSGNIITGFFDTILGKAKASVSDLLKISDLMTGVEKTSGLASEQVKELWDNFDQLNTRTSKQELLNIAQIGGRLGITDKEELRSFTEEIDKIYVALGDSFQGGLEEVTTKVGKLKNLFEETKNQNYGEALNAIGSALNELGANGTASEQNISDFATRIGALPATLKPAIDKTLGLGAAFEEAGINSEIGASGFSTFLSKAGNNISAFAQQMKISSKEAQELFNTKPEEFFLKFAESLKGLGAEQTSGIFKGLKLNTLEVQKVLGTASDNANRFRELMQLAGNSMIEGTSIQEEFNKVNNNTAAIWEKIKKVWDETFTSRNVLEWFSGAIKVLGDFIGATDESGNGVAKFREKISFLFKVIGVTITALASYKIAMVAISLVTKRATEQTLLYNIALKAKQVWLGLVKAATILYAGAKALLTWNLTRATAAMHLFNATTKLNPLGALIAVVTAAVVAFKAFNNSVDEATKQQQRYIDRQNRMNEKIDEKRIALQNLLKVAQDENQSEKERIKAIEKINNLSPKHLGFLNLKNIKTKEATDAVNNYVKALEKQAMAEILLEDKKEILKERRKIQQTDTARFGEGRMQKISNWIFGETSLKDNMEDQVAEYMKKYEGKVDEKTFEELKKNYTENIQSHYDEKRKALQDLQNREKELDKEYEKLIKEDVNIITGGADEINNGTSYTSQKEKKDFTNDYRSAQKARLEAEKELQKEITQNLEESLDKQLAIAEQKYNEKKFKLQQQNQDLETEIQKLSTPEKGESPQQKALREKIIEEKKALISLNNQIEIEYEKQKNTDLESIQQKFLITQYEKKAQQNQKEINLAQQQMREEILLLESLEEAKQKIKENRLKEPRAQGESEERFQKKIEKELANVKTLEDAKKILREQANQEILQRTYQALEQQKKLIISFIESASGEAKEKLISELEELDKKILEIREKSTPSEGKEGDISQVDFLGFNGSQWENLWNNLDTTEGKIRAVEMGVGALNNAFSLFAQAQQNANDKEMKSFSENQKKQKAALLQRLNDGYISQAQYQKELQRLDEEAETKKKELNLKQFKAQKAMNMLNIIANTATGVMRAYSDAGPIGGTVFAAIIGALGAVQLGIVAAQQPPSYAKGGFTKGLGFRDESGYEVAGVVHEEEYVVPQWLRRDPEVAKAVEWLEAKRTGKNATYAQGGEAIKNTTSNPEIVKTLSNENSFLSINPQIEKLNHLLEKLDKNGIDAYVIADAKNGKEFHKAIKLYQGLKEKNKH